VKLSVPIVLLGWPLVSLLLFVFLSPRRALIANFVAGWLIIPVASLPLPGFPEFSKTTSMAVGAVLGVLLFDARRLGAFRPRPFDLPALALVLAPFPAALANGLGAYDGLSGVLGAFEIWGVPWMIGRLYGRDPHLLRDVEVAVVIGALAYVPICLWEIRMSPQLNYWLYGFYPFRFHTTRRLGGYRPVGFFRHGIELGMMMMSAALISVSFQLADKRDRILGVPITWVSAILLATTALTRALGGLILLAAGTVAMLITRISRRPILIGLLILAPLAYIGLRFSGTMPEERLVSLAASVSPERAASLETRLEHEAALADKAFERPIFGWSGWGRSRVYDERGKDRSLTDGLWIILFGQYGLVGLGSWLAIMLGPPVLAWRRLGTQRLLEGSSAPALAAVILLPLHTVNWLVNGFVNPVVPMLASALLALGGSASGTSPRRRSRRRGTGGSQPAAKGNSRGCA
jgi:hypothetical protein